jgi:acetyltransferase
MTTRNLEALFEPRAIALIGASNQPRSVGQVLARNLMESGFKGPVMPVNPHEGAIRSALAYKALADLPTAPDLAVIATPAETVPGLIGELAARGCRAAVVISAGLSEPSIRKRMLEAARPGLLRIVGPNCLGVISPAQGLNASFAHLTPEPGGLALVAQSGAVTTAALDWAVARGYGFSRIVTLGDMADVDFGDMLDFLALDAATDAILLYVESITDARKFMSACRMASRNKPVVVIKSGRSAAGARAAMSHTGALAGADAVYEAAFRRAGALRVDELRDLFDAVSTLAGGRKLRGERLTIITNGGGAGVMAADALALRGGRQAELSAQTLAALDKALPASWSNGNPVDILGDAQPERYRAALAAVLADPGSDAVLVLNCPVAVADSTAAARTVLEAISGPTDGRALPPVFTCWLGDASAAAGRRLFAAAKVPTHETPDEAVRAFLHLVEYGRNQALLLEAPPAGDGDAADFGAARVLLDKVAAEGREQLTEPEAKALLKACGVPIVASEIAATPEEAGEVAQRLGGAVALKIHSPDISHKSDSGGVSLHLTGAAAVEAEARAMLARVAAKVPGARLEGFIVEAMAIRPKAQELIAGISVDPTFGPIVLFGAGGVAVEVLGDRSIGLPPLNPALARDMVSRTRIARLLGGYRDRPPADMDALAGLLCTLGRMAVELPQIAELDINPLLADGDGVLAVDARVRIAPVAGRPRSAIAPYPDGLTKPLTLDDGATITLRPIRPQDAEGLIDLVDRASSEDVRLRFRGGVARLPREWAARLSQIDYDREMALVADAGADGIWGVARYAADPEGLAAEFALAVRTDRQKHGLGGTLLNALIDEARRRGLKEIWGEVEARNGRMLELAKSLGFDRRPASDLSLVRVTLSLG